jgi:hypothetical protein
MSLGFKGLSRQLLLPLTFRFAINSHVTIRHNIYNDYTSIRTLIFFLINKSECVCVCLFVCMYFNKKLYILLVSASLLRFLIIATTIETETFLW